MNELDLTKKNDVIILMKSSKNDKEWNENANKVKKANGGQYPYFWFDVYMMINKK